MSYRGDLPGGDRPYVDPRIERQRWELERPDVEARWLVPVLARLAKGEALTSDLAGVAAIKPGVEYGRFMVMLHRYERLGQLRRVGQRRGVHHMNNVWELIK